MNEQSGEYAFPGKRVTSQGFPNGMNMGISLRAYIATKVIGGLCANPSIFQPNDQYGWDLVNCTERQLSDCAIRIADEMIASLSLQKP